MNMEDYTYIPDFEDANWAGEVFEAAHNMLEHIATYKFNVAPNNFALRNTFAEEKKRISQGVENLERLGITIPKEYEEFFTTLDYSMIKNTDQLNDLYFYVDQVADVTAKLIIEKYLAEINSLGIDFGAEDEKDDYDDYDDFNDEYYDDNDYYE